MRRLVVAMLLTLLVSPTLMADTGDTAVFRVALRPGNEVPAVNSPGSTGMATITTRVTRDGRGNVDAASVIFDVDYTVAAATTFTGLHIHHQVAGSNGAVVIDSGITAASPVNAPVGSGRITRVVNYTSAETDGIKFVTGLMAVPEQYYVNIHSTSNPSGLMRGQLVRNRLIFRPVMSTVFEVPAGNLDAEGAALVEVEVNRNNDGVITSGRVTFDVEYRFPAGITFTGLHIHSGAFGVNGPVVIDSGLNGNVRSVVSTTGRGNMFRVAEIDSTNTTAIAALNGLFNDPTAYYINMHTSVNPGGAIRGQLSSDRFAFFNTLTAAEEVPPTSTTGIANSMTYVHLNRDTTGNVINGGVSFNVNYDMGTALTFTGLHIHNARFGVNGGVIIDSGLSGTNPVVDSDGSGSINREVAITSGNALEALKAIINNPEGYYVNLHTTSNPGGIVRAQLQREKYHFRAAMSPGNEVPPIDNNASATAWLTAVISRDGTGTINGGTVTFDVNHVIDGQTTFTGLHIHTGAAGTNGGVVIDSGITGANNVVSATGSGNINRTAVVTSANGIAMLNTLINNPDLAYVNLHTTTSPGGFLRSQILPQSRTIAQTAGGGDWISVVTLRNPSSTTGVQGIVNFLQSNGTAFPTALSDPNLTFWIAPGSSATFNLHNRGTLTSGYARIFSNGALNADVRYLHPGFSPSTEATTVTSRAVSVPVNVNTSTTRNTGIAIVAHTAGNLVLTLRDSTGAQIANGSRTIDVTAGQHVVAFARDLFPGVTQTQFTGTVEVAANATSGNGSLSVLGLQLNGTLVPVTVTPLP